MIERIYVDTNCFIHLRDLKDLPWREVFPGVSEIEIVVAPVVIDELDRLKVEKGSRTRDRCRAALALIESASDQPDMRCQLRQTPISISLSLGEAQPIDWSIFPRLDATRPDDRLVAAALSDQRTPQSRLLSFDTGPLIRARSVGLRAVKSPESWALPPQHDVSEQKIARLERDLELSRATKPKIIARFIDGQPGSLHLPLPQLEPLSAEIQSKLINRLKKDHPREMVVATQETMHGIALGLGGIDKYQVDSYNRDYDRFLESAKKQFQDLHALMSDAFRFGEVRFQIENDSAVTAANLRVQMSCSEEWFMLGTRADLEPYGGALRRLKPPKRPKGYSDLSHLHSQLAWREPRRDPTGFYWLQRPEGGDVGTLVCEEFRPTSRRVDSFFVGGAPDAGCHVEVEITATNLPLPVFLEAEVTITSQASDWDNPSVLRRLPAWISEIIAASA